MHPSRRDRRWPFGTIRLVWMIAAFVLVAGFAVALVTGLSPWPMIALDVALITLAIGQRTSWALAFAAGTLVLLAGAAIFAQLAPWILPRFELSSDLVLVLAGAALAVLLAVSPRVRLPAPRTALGVVPAVALPLIALGLVARAGLRGRLGFAWAMNNDAVWNMVTARFVIADGGVVSAHHANASPLAPVLMAISAASGRANVSAADLLRHDVTRSAELWLVLAAMTAALAGLIAVRATRSARLPLLIGAPIVISAIPLAWSTFGYALDFGFYNATVALVILLAAWLAWSERASSPAGALAALSLASIAMLATWGPLTLVPGALLAVQLATLLRARVWTRRRPLIIGALALALLVLYVGLVTLPDLLRQGGALSADGGIFRFTPVQASIAVGATATILFLAASVKQSWTQLVGTVTVLLSSAIGVGFLLYQRRTTGELWGYYPVKFTWLITSLLLVVAAAALVSIAARLRGRFWLAALTLVAGAGLLWSTMWQIGPAYLPRIEHTSPITDIIQSSGVASLDPAADILFSVATPKQRTMDVRLGGAQYDRFANFWLLQLHSTTAKDPMRTWAYFLDPENQVKVCKAIEAWKAPVVVRTNDPGVEGRLKAQCPTADFTVQMGL